MFTSLEESWFKEHHSPEQEQPYHWQLTRILRLLLFSSVLWTCVSKLICHGLKWKIIKAIIFLKRTINKQILLKACYFFFIGYSFSEVFETYKINFKISLVYSDEWAHKWSIGRIFSLSLRAREDRDESKERLLNPRCPPKSDNCRQLQTTGTRVNSDLGVRDWGLILWPVMSLLVLTWTGRSCTHSSFAPYSSMICDQRFNVQHQCCQSSLFHSKVMENHHSL